MGERNYTSKEVLLMTKIRKSNTKCYYCGCTVEEDKRTVDHKTPVSRGGLTVEENLEMSCKACNLEKGFLTEEEYNEFLNQVNDIVGNSISVIHLTALVNTYKDIIDNIKEQEIKLKDTNKEISEIEFVIRDSKLSASDGYKLCKMLQDNLLHRDVLKKNVADLQRINGDVKKNHQSLSSKLNSVRTKIRNNYRNEYINSKQIILN